MNVSAEEVVAPEEKSKMLVKTLTFGLGNIFSFDKTNGELIELDAEQRKNLYNEISKGTRDFARICNVTASLLYSGRILKANIKDWGYNTSYAPIIEKLGYIVHLNGLVLNQIYSVVTAHFSGEHGKKLFRSGESVLPSHRTNGTHPIYFHKDAVEIVEINKILYIVYHIFAEKWAKENSISSWVAFRIKIKHRDRSGLDQLNKIISKEWQAGQGQLAKNNRKKGPKYLMRLCVKYEPSPYKNLSEDVCMGINLGVDVPAAIHFRVGDKFSRWSMCIGDGINMLRSRGIERHEIIRLLRAFRTLTGKDKESVRNKIRIHRKKEQRKIKTECQKIAARIADQAKRNGAGVWTIEDLNLIDMKFGKPWLIRNWSAGVLIDAIRWQAKQLGVKLKFVNPQYVAQRCSDCGYIVIDNMSIDNKRPRSKKKESCFKCPKCGYNDHMDKNAARNLSIKGIEEIIEEELTKFKAPNGADGESAVL